MKQKQAMPGEDLGTSEKNFKDFSDRVEKAQAAVQDAAVAPATTKRLRSTDRSRDCPCLA